MQANVLKFFHKRHEISGKTSARFSQNLYRKIFFIFFPSCKCTNKHNFSSTEFNFYSYSASEICAQVSACPCWTSGKQECQEACKDFFSQVRQSVHRLPKVVRKCLLFISLFRLTVCFSYWRQFQFHRNASTARDATHIMPGQSSPLSKLSRDKTKNPAFFPHTGNDAGCYIVVLSLIRLCPSRF